MQKPFLLALLIGLIGGVVAITAQQVSSPELREYATPAGLEELLSSQDENVLLVDVRTQREYNAGHIPGAINVPYQQIQQDLPAAEGDPIIVVYCQSGRRSGIAFSTLRRQGYERIVDFGGIVRWQGELER